MAETNIAKTSLQVGVNTSGLYSGLSSAASGIKSWAGGITSTLGKAFQGSAFGTLSKGLGAGIAGALSGGIGAAMAGIGIGSDFLKDGIEKIKELAKAGRTAKSIGLLSEDFMSLSLQAEKFGVNSEQMTKGLIKFNASTADMGGMAIGGNWVSFDGKDLMGKFEGVADAISKIPDPAHQAQAAIMAFGKQGPALLPLLTQGAEGIEKFKAKQMEMGNAVGQKDMSRVMLAQQALPKVGEMIEGFKTKMSVALAPLIIAFGKVFDLVMPYVQRILSFFADIYSAYVTRMAQIWTIIGDTLGKLGAMFTELISSWIKIEGLGDLGEVISQVWDGVIGIFEMVMTWIVELGKEVMELGKSFGTFEIIIPNLKTLVDQGCRATAKGVAYVFDAIKAGAGSLILTLGKTVEVIGAMGKKLGLSWGDKWEQAGTNMEKLGAAWMQGFGDSAGKVDKFFDDMKKRKEDAKADAINTADAMMKEYHPIASIMQGSKEAASLEAKWRTGNLVNPQLQVQQKQLAEQQKGNGFLGNILEMAKRGGVKLEVV